MEDQRVPYGTMEPLRGAIANASGIMRAVAGKVVKDCAWVTEREGRRLLGAGEGVFLETVTKTDDDVACQGKEKADNEHDIGMLLKLMCVIKQAFQQQQMVQGRKKCSTRGLEYPIASFHRLTLPSHPNSHGGQSFISVIRVFTFLVSLKFKVLKNNVLKNNVALSH